MSWRRLGHLLAAADAIATLAVLAATLGGRLPTTVGQALDALTTLAAAVLGLLAAAALAMAVACLRALRQPPWGAR